MKTKSTLKETLSLALLLAVAFVLQFALGGCVSESFLSSAQPKGVKYQTDKHFGSLLHIVGDKVSVTSESPKDREYYPDGKLKSEKFIIGPDGMPVLAEIWIRDTGAKQPETLMGVISKVAYAIPWLLGTKYAFDALEGIGGRDTQVITQPTIQDPFVLHPEVIKVKE